MYTYSRPQSSGQKVLCSTQTRASCRLEAVSSRNMAFLNKDFFALQKRPGVGSSINCKLVLSCPSGVLRRLKVAVKTLKNATIAVRVGDIMRLPPALRQAVCFDFV